MIKKKQIEQIHKEYKHYVYKEIGFIKGYKLTNETNESEGVVINDIKIEINLESQIGQEFWNKIRDKFKPENLSNKYATLANYIYSEKEENGMMNVAIKILTNKTDPLEVKAKKKLLHKINKYT
ncbi:MAG: hypothetical protein NC299_09805 [Lachnospiraceae bacterium]|nr:hypothetical protein [Ruminococcus sp.]MCM1275648.1 hypothetical protein [Lachnospiraceae bacterium]